MTRLDPADDDQRLQAGQMMGERLASVDHDVWCCDQCGHTVRDACPGWFTRYGACRSCVYRTLPGASHVVTPAPTSSTGLRRTGHICQFCGNAYRSTRIIPRESERSSSSSGSFGGGRPRGGGASGRW